MKVLKLVLFNISFSCIAYGMEKFLKPERNRPKTNENIIFALASMHKARLNKTLSVLRAGKKIEEKNNETPPTSEKIRFSQKILLFLIDRMFSKPEMPYKNFLRDQLHSINGMTLRIYKISNQMSNKEGECYALWEMDSLTRDIITVMSEEIFIDENETNEGGAEEKSKIEIQEEICPNQRGNSGNNASKRKNSYP